nr:HEPN domain-containing protein [Candidatus Njordarchaeota archaeon]
MSEARAKEINDAILKAKRFLRDAKVLLHDGGFDSTAGRCYYAMFLMAEVVLLTKGLRAKSHKGVIALLGQHFINKRILSEELGKSLKAAHESREAGDYEIKFAVSEKEAKESVKRATRFVEETEKYLGSKRGSLDEDADAGHKERGKACSSV